jgi:cold shock protein
VATGKVKRFNGQKGYRFIQPDAGGKDVFVHISAVEKAGYDGLVEGAEVSFASEPWQRIGREFEDRLRCRFTTGESSLRLRAGGRYDLIKFFHACLPNGLQIIGRSGSSLGKLDLANSRHQSA